MNPEINEEEILNKYIERTYTFSSQDKLDWDNDIELLMKLAIFARGTRRHHKWVLRLESAVETDFSGVNLRTPIVKNRERLNELAEIEEKKMIVDCNDGVYYFPETMDDLTCRDRDIIRTKTYHWYWEKRFAFVRDLLAHHRGLLWGRKSISGGTPMERVD